jgi:hypothetical protein
MSYQERRAIVSIISTILITVLYAAYMVQRYPQADPYAPEIFQYWGSFFMILIPVSIVARIIITIIFSIINEVATHDGEPSITDERDKMIGLKSFRNGFVMFSAGFLLAMGAVAVSLPPAIMFIIMLCGGIVSDIVSEASSFFFYRRGY